jgi:hypothetical protein
MERLKMPANKTYFKNFQITLDLLNINRNEKKVKNKSYKVFPKTDISQDIKLTGIFKIGNKFFAIINGEPFTAGSEINGYKILSVNIRKVLLYNKKNKEKVALKIEN